MGSSRKTGNYLGDRSIYLHSKIFLCKEKEIFFPVKPKKLIDMCEVFDRSLGTLHALYKTFDNIVDWSTRLYVVQSNHWKVFSVLCVNSDSCDTDESNFCLLWLPLCTEEQ